MAECGVYCLLEMNLGEVNISNKTIFTLTFYLTNFKDGCGLRCNAIWSY